MQVMDAAWESGVRYFDAARSYGKSELFLQVLGWVLQCVAVCCNVLQCVAVCCGVLQCVSVCCSYGKSEFCVEVLQYVLQCVTVYCSVP